MSRVTRSIPLILYAALIFYLSSVPGSEIPSQISPYSLLLHFLLYMFFSLPIYLFFQEPFYSYLFGTLYAFSDELHQLFVPGRSCDPLDYLADSTGLAVGLLIILLILSPRMEKLLSTHKT